MATFVRLNFWNASVCFKTKKRLLRTLSYELNLTSLHVLRLLNCQKVNEVLTHRHRKKLLKEIHFKTHLLHLYELFKYRIILFNRKFRCIALHYGIIIVTIIIHFYQLFYFDLNYFLCSRLFAVTSNKQWKKTLNYIETAKL